MEVDLEDLEHPARAEDNARAPAPPPPPPPFSSSSSSTSSRRARTAALSPAPASLGATPYHPAPPRRRPKLRPRQVGLGEPTTQARSGARPGVSALAWVLGGALLWRGGVSATAMRVVAGKANSVALVNAALGRGGLGGGGLPWACEAGAGRGGAASARSPARLGYTIKRREHGQRSWEEHTERRERPGRGGDGPGENDARVPSRGERRHHRSPTKWAGDVYQPREAGAEAGRGRSPSTPASLTSGGGFEGGARENPANPVLRGNLPLAREQQLQVAVAETGAAGAAAVAVGGAGGGGVGPAAQADVGDVNGKLNAPVAAIAAASGEGNASNAAKGRARRPRERASAGGKGERQTRLSEASGGGGGSGGSGGGDGSAGDGDSGGRSGEASGTDSVRMRRFLPGGRSGEHAAAGAAATGGEQCPPLQRSDEAKAGTSPTPRSAAKGTAGGGAGRRLRVRGKGAARGGSSKGKANSETSPKFPRGGAAAAAAAAAATAARLSGAAAAREIVRESERAARAKDSAAESKMGSSDDEAREMVLSSTIRRRCPPAVGFVSGFREISASDAAAAATAALGKRGGASGVGGVDALIRVLSEPPEPSPRQTASPLSQRAYSSTGGDAISDAGSNARNENAGSGVRTSAAGNAAVGDKGNGGKGEGAVLLSPSGQRASADLEPSSSRKSQKGKPHPDARSAYPGVAQSATELNYKALDPPSRSVSIKFNPEASSLLSCVTTSSDVYGDALHDSKAPEMTRAATAAYLERWVLIAVKHGVLPRELRALLQDGEPDSLDFYGRSKRRGRADGGGGGERYGARAGASLDRAAGAGGGGGAGAGYNGSPEAAVSWTKYGWNRLDASRPPPSPPPLPASVSSSSSSSAVGTAGSHAGGAFSFGKPPAARSAAAGEGRAAGPPSSEPPLAGDDATAAAAAGVKNGRGNQRQQQQGGGETPGEVGPEGGGEEEEEEEAGRDEEAEEEEEMENVAEALVGGEREEDAHDWNPGSSMSTSSPPRPAQQPTWHFGGSVAGRGDARDRRRPADGRQDSGAAGARGGGGRAEGSDLSLGWRVLEAVEARFASRLHPPRIIAIGDVHGCLDELKDLVRKVEYWPGDLLLFLGDLVAKGPNSSGVVRLARELGGVSVRGNHEFEVLRWLNVGESEDGRAPSRHHKIAMALSEEDGDWLKASPWFFRCDDLDSLFVHAGFVPGVGMRRQNPRMMMNMRSVSDEGVPTSKVLETRPWARQWRGPPTVFFGHDADRGLQVLDHAMGLDTGCVYGGRLTACILPDRRLVSVASKAAYIEYRRRGWARDVANAQRVSSSSGVGSGGGKGRNGKNGNSNGRH